MSTPTVEVIEHAVCIRIETSDSGWLLDPVTAERIDGLGLRLFDIDSAAVRGVAVADDRSAVDELVQQVSMLSRELDELDRVELRDDLALVIVEGTDAGSLHRGVSALGEAAIEVIAVYGDGMGLAWLVPRFARQRAADVLRSIHAPL